MPAEEAAAPGRDRVGDNGAHTKPGVYYNLSWAEYQLLPALNHSKLKLFKQTSLHARAGIERPEPPSTEKDVGHALHAAVLEPRRFQAEWCVPPKCDRRYAKGKAIWDAHELANEGKEILTDPEWRRCMGMSNAAHADPTIAEIIGGEGANEVTIVWDRDGIRCKARLDRVTAFGAWTVVADIKSTKDGSPRGFPREIAKYDYHTQAQWYTDGLARATGDDYQRRHLILALENFRPYAAATYELEAMSMEQAKDDNRKRFDAYRAARDTGIWPGYPTGITEIALPRWAINPEEWQA